MISVGPVTIHLYGLIIGMAVIAALEWVHRVAMANKMDVSRFDQMSWKIILAGIVGARLYHVVDYWWYYSNHLAEVLAVWQGGLGIWGAIMGGLVAMGFLKEKRAVWLDLIALAVPLGQAIGRWGNWVNHELFGRPTSLPWGWWMPVEYRPEQYKQSSLFHPLFLYESLLNVGLFIGLNVWNKKRGGLGTGIFIGGYLIGYGLIRMGLEPLRIDNWQLGGLATAQWISLLAIFIGSGLVLRCRIKR